MAIDKKSFLKAVTILYDTREHKNKHILDKLSEGGIMIEERKLDYGDYSFMADGRDYSMSCVVERKGSVDEIYGNIMNDGDRLKKELYAASCLSKELTLLIEGVSSWETLKIYRVPDYQMRESPQRVNRDIGANVYVALKAWSVSNRYAFKVEFAEKKEDTANKILEVFYYYWRTYKELTAARKGK